ncbi:MAG TPA: type II toxin-antitoxin system RelE/ParE family toxin [Pirellulales bacterium]
MRPYIVAPEAQRDIQNILAWTDEQYGGKACLRYEALLIQAVVDIADSPERPGTHDRREIAPTARVYHLRHSRTRVARMIGRVKNPRHVLLFRLRKDGAVEIARVLHDSMDLEKHLPAGFVEENDRDD